MSTRKVTLSAICGVLLTTMLAGPVSAAKPARPSPEASAERPLTAEERQRLLEAIAAAELEQLEDDARQRLASVMVS